MKNIKGVGTRFLEMDEIKETNNKIIILLIIADIFLLIWGVAYVLLCKEVGTILLFIYFTLVFIITFKIFHIKHRNKELLDQLNRCRIGIEGEREVCNELCKLLPNSYLIFNDLRIRVNNSSAQIDHLVIGQNGLFLVETKSYAGSITITENGDVCRRDRNTGKKVISSKEKDQIMHHEYILRKKLSNLRFKTMDVNRINNLSINSILLFTHRAKHIDGRTPFFFNGYANESVDFILNRESEINLSKNQINEIIKVLKRENRR